VCILCDNYVTLFKCVFDFRDREELKPNPIRHLVPITMNDGPYDLMGGKKRIDVTCE